MPSLVMQLLKTDKPNSPQTVAPMTLMRRFEVMALAIPRGQAAEVADELGVNPNTVARWRTEPLSDESPTASGRGSPLDHFLDLMRAVYLANPSGAQLLIEYIEVYYRNLKAPGQQICQRHDPIGAAMIINTKSTQVVNALMQQDPEVKQHCEALRRALGDIILNLPMNGAQL